MKQLGIISKSEKRGECSFSNIKKIEISPPNRTLIAFSTYLGIALSENWSYIKWMSLFGITHAALLILFHMRVLIELNLMQPGTLSIHLPMPPQ